MDGLFHLISMLDGGRGWYTGFSCFGFGDVSCTSDLGCFSVGIEEFVVPSIFLLTLVTLRSRMGLGIPQFDGQSPAYFTYAR